jgi:hypothetical protein
MAWFPETDPSWVASADRALSADHERSSGPLTLLELADELELWADGGRASAWSRNRKLLLPETEATIAEALGWADPVTADLLHRLDTALRGLQRLDEAGRATLRGLIQELRGCLLADSAIAAQGQRLLAAAQDPAISSEELLRVRELLEDQLRGTRRDPRTVLSNASQGLRGIGFDVAPDLDLAARTAVAIEAITEPAVSKPLIVWLAYDDARLGSGFVEAGPVTFYSGQWAIANAREGRNRAIPHFSELEAVVNEEHSSWDDPEINYKKVLARVDLGLRPTYQAFEDAAELVSVIVDAGVISANGLRWRPSGTAELRVEGGWRGTQRFGPFTFESHTADAINETGAEVVRWANRLGARLSVAELPRLLIDAVSRVASRGDLEDNVLARPLRRLRDRDTRAATLLDDQAVEAVAGWASVDTRVLDVALREEWIEARWRSEVAHVIRTAIWAARNAEDRRGWELERAVMERRDDGEVMLLGRALIHEQEILAVLTDPHDRARGELVISALRDPVAFRAVVDEGRARLALDLARYDRVRNALTHGNPVTSAVVSRGRELARFLARGAVDLGLGAFAEGRSLVDHIELRTAARRSQTARFEAGETWAHIWGDPVSPPLAIES